MDRKRILVLAQSPLKEVEQFLAGKETIIQWLMGQVARATKGKSEGAAGQGVGSEKEVI